MTNNKLNNARMITFGGYKAVFDVEHVMKTKTGDVYRGRAVPIPKPKHLPGDPNEFIAPGGWLYFLEEYDDRNDWDRLYHSLTFEDPDLIGVPFRLIPKEKLLFAYNPPSTIELPPVNFGR